MWDEARGVKGGAMQREISIRDSRDEDVTAIAAIYAHWVHNGFGSFEIEPPGEREMAERRAHTLGGGLPYLVAACSGAILGYAYAGPYRPREAYRFTCEDSIYVAPDACGQGVGRALLAALIARCEALHKRLMVAVIGDSANAASIGLHAALGFSHAGILPAIGWKGERWLDSVFMTRAIGAGASAPPDSACSRRNHG